MKKILSLLTILVLYCILTTGVNASIFGPYDTALSNTFTVELYSDDCIKVTEFEAVSIVIPEDYYMLYRVSNTQRSDFPQRSQVWILEGIYEIKLTISDDLQWFFRRDYEDKLKKVEFPSCGLSL